jgi:hypothetical protein
MRTTVMLGALAVFAAVPAAAQGKFRTGGIDPNRGTPTTTNGGQVLGDILGTRDSAEHRRGSDKIPPGQRPPAGMCRIWIDGVPPGQQPAPTDCQTAVANKPANARVIWGDQTAFPGKGKGKGKGKFSNQSSGKKNHGIKDRDEGDDDDQGDFRAGDRRGKSIASLRKKG